MCTLIVASCLFALVSSLAERAFQSANPSPLNDKLPPNTLPPCHLSKGMRIIIKYYQWEQKLLGWCFPSQITLHSNMKQHVTIIHTSNWVNKQQFPITSSQLQGSSKFCEIRCITKAPIPFMAMRSTFFGAKQDIDGVGRWMDMYLSYMI